MQYHNFLLSIYVGLGVSDGFRGLGDMGGQVLCEYRGRVVSGVEHCAFGCGGGWIVEPGSCGS